MPLGSFRLNTLSAAIAAGGGGIPYISATGGTMTYPVIGTTTYKVHKFETAGSNSFIVSSAAAGAVIDALLVGGGGSGGHVGTTFTYGAGGGGAGQVRQQTSVSITAQTYSLTVATGGTPSSNSGVGVNGGNSTGFGFTANGGGGGSTNPSVVAGASVTGGSGGGGAASITASAGGTGTYNGAAGKTNSTGGGGGGAAGAGAQGTVGSSGGAGGSPLAVVNFSATGTVNYGGGGQGGYASGTGSSNSLRGGGGGGGGGGTNTGRTGSDGTIIVRYPITPVSSITYTSQTNSSTTTLTFPTIQAGDIAVYLSRARNTNSTTPTFVTPSGFTQISQEIGGALGTRITTFYKICTGTESGTSIACMSGTGATNTTVLIYRPDTLPNTIIASVDGLAVTDSVPASQTLDNSALSGPFIGFAFYASSGAITTRGSTVVATRELTFGTTQGYVKTFEATTTGATKLNSTISMTDNGTNGLMSFKLKII